MLPSVLSFFDFLDFQVLKSLVFHRALKVLIALLHLFCSLDGLQFYSLNPFCVVDLLKKLLGVREVSEVNSNRIKESQNG